MQRLEFRAMGCQMLVLVDSLNQVDELGHVPEWFENWEQALSRFRQDSELNQLNQHAGSPFHASETLWQVIQAALQAARASQGLVSPTTLPALEAAGYDRTFGSLEPDRVIQKPRWNMPDDWRAIECDESARTIYLPHGIRLDLGGVAKGWAADQAAQRLGVHAPALVNAGGDMAITRPQANGNAWTIGVADPSDPARNLATLMIDQGAVATSGRDYRRWQKNGVWQHHLIDPRTGLPAETDVITATVIAPTTLQAEVAAKTAFILGSIVGMRWLENAGLEGLLVLENGYVVYSHGLENYMELICQPMSEPMMS